MPNTKEGLNGLLETDMIPPSSSSCSFPVDIATKKDRRPRFCVYYLKIKRMMNKNGLRPPKIQELLDELPGAKLFTTLNIYIGHQYVGMV